MPDFGIGEGIAALLSAGLSSAAEGAGAIGAADALGAGALGAGAAGTAGAAGEALGGAGFTSEGLPFLTAAEGAAGAAAPAAFTVNALPGAAAAGAGAEGAGAGLGLGGALSWLSDAFVPSAGAAEFGGGTAAAPSLGSGGGIGPTPDALGGAGGGGGAGISSFAPAGGIDAGAPVDLTSSSAIGADGVSPPAPFDQLWATRTGGGGFDVSGLGSSPLGGGLSGASPNAATGQLGFAGESAAPVATPTGTPAVDTSGGLDAIASQAGQPQATGASSIAYTPEAGVPVAGGAPGVTSATPTPSGGGNFFDKLVTGAEKSITGNPLGIGLGGAGLALSLARANAKPEGYGDLQAAAANLKNTGSVLQQYMLTGTLPPGMQQSVDLATKSAKARIVAGYASRGQTADPTRNSALASELAQVDQNAIITAATIGDKLMSQGLSAAQISEQIYAALMNTNVQQNQQVGSAIASFGAALGGGPKVIGVNLK